VVDGALWVSFKKKLKSMGHFRLALRNFSCLLPTYPFEMTGDWLNKELNTYNQINFNQNDNH